MSTTEHKGWIGVDLDGTLAHYDAWKGVEHIGEPVKPMLDRVKKWLEEGKEVRIFTARVWPLDVYESTTAVYIPFGCPDKRMIDAGNAGHVIREWCKKHLGQVLPITCRKDFGMVECWDDRSVGVMLNKGVDRETLLSWHLLRVIEAAGIKVTTGASYAAAADEGAAKIGAIIRGFEDAEADLDGALSALFYVKGQKPEEDERNVRHAMVSLTKALKAIRRGK